MCVRNLSALVTSHIAHVIHLDALSQLGGWLWWWWGDEIFIFFFQCKSSCHFVAIAHISFPLRFPSGEAFRLASLPVDKLSHLDAIGPGQHQYSVVSKRAR